MMYYHIGYRRHGSVIYVMRLWAYRTHRALGDRSLTATIYDMANIYSYTRLSTLPACYSDYSYYLSLWGLFRDFSSIG